MKIILPKRARQVSLAQMFRISLLFVMLAGYTGLKAQTGTLSFSALSAADPSTGMQRCTVSWTGHAASVDLLNITFGFSGTIPICIDVAATLSSIPAVLAPFATVNSGAVSIIDIGTTINVSAVSTPVIIHFRGQPGSNMTLGASLAKMSVPGSSALNDITVNSQLVTFATGYSISGVVQKLGGTACTGGTGNGITGVTFTLALTGSPTCVPGGISFPTNNTPPADWYSFTNLPRNYNYSITPSKSAGCECDPLGPINSVDINMGRSYILGTAIPTILQVHSSDYNASNSLTTYDLVLMSQCNLGTPSVPSVWQFTTAFTNTTTTMLGPLPVIPAGSLAFPNLTANQAAGAFIGFKRGDVDQNCSACGSSFTGAAEERDRVTVATKGVSLPDIGLQAGQEMTVPVLASDAVKGLAVLGMEWLLDERIELLDVKQALDEEYGNYRERRQGRHSILHYNWFTMTDGGIDVEPGEALIYLRIRALSDITSVKDVISLMPLATNNKLFYENGQSDAQWRVGTPDGEQESAQILLKILGTAHTSGMPAQLEVYVHQASSVQLVLSDMSGRIISTRVIESAEKGWSLYQLDIPASSGMYQVTARSAFGTQTARLIRY